MARNIILLSDGTGNSAAKAFKTNVWRLYQALDLRDNCEPCQIAYYDNGVGTENYKPLAAMTGAFGIGVWQNVRDLYTFLCRNYNPIQNDKIFVFGFSRGSFTARLLCALIGKVGVVKANDESQLSKAVEMAYIEFRRDFLIRASQTRQMIYPLIVREPIYELAKTAKGYRQSRIRFPAEAQSWPEIAFLGVWDTVDAYGMPVDELKQGLDRWIWPMSMADRQLSPSVRCARHALSIDDARPAFRPVLWSEKTIEGEPLPNEACVKQVWFAGVHADVGGGYPDDALANVSLDWMMGEALAAGLHLLPDAREKVQSQANTHGEQHDSREGLAGYYRYGPRNIARLCHDECNKVFVDKPKVHRSVMERIGRRRVDYSPISLPRSFLEENAWVPLPDNPYILTLRTPLPSEGEPGAEAAMVNEAMELALDAVWLRRLAYLATVLLSIVLVIFPLFAKWLIGSEALHAVKQPLLDITPGWSHYWVAAYLQHWPISLVFFALLVWLFFWASPALQKKINCRAEIGWAQIKQNTEHQDPKPNTLDRWARNLRTSSKLVSVYRAVTGTVIPLLFTCFIGPFVFIAAVIKLRWEEIKRRRWLPINSKTYVSPH